MSAGRAGVVDMQWVVDMDSYTVRILFSWPDCREVMTEGGVVSWCWMARRGRLGCRMSRRKRVWSVATTTRNG